MGGARRALVVGAVLGVALLCAPVACADGPVEVRTRLNGFCLDIQIWPHFSSPDDYDVVINPCNGRNTEQWIFNPAGQMESVGLPGHCLYLSGPQDGASTGLTTCQNPISPTKRLWTRQPNGQITNALGPCLAVGRGGSTAPNTPVIGFHCTADTPGQEWV